jgi:hypothetical protein
MPQSSAPIFSRAQTGDPVVDVSTYDPTDFPKTQSLASGKNTRKVPRWEIGVSGSVIHPGPGTVQTTALVSKGRYSIASVQGGWGLDSLLVTKDGEGGSYACFKTPPDFESTACNPCFVITDGPRRKVHSLQMPSGQKSRRWLKLGEGGVSYDSHAGDKVLTIDDQGEFVGEQS